VHFADPTVEGLLEAIHTLEREESRFDPKAIRTHAERFSTERFLHEIGEEIDATLASART
jgi:hypothetical protein